LVWRAVLIPSVAISRIGLKSCSDSFCGILTGYWSGELDLVLFRTIHRIGLESCSDSFCGILTGYWSVELDLVLFRTIPRIGLESWIWCCFAPFPGLVWRAGSGAVSHHSQDWSVELDLVLFRTVLMIFFLGAVLIPSVES
jgi:hypothetical protein